MQTDTPDLPAPIAAYFAADAEGDTEALMRSFADDAVVRDEGATHKGPDAIRAWRQNAKAAYSYEMRPLGATVEDGRVVVSGRVTGNFPGSPATLHYAFTLRDDRIARLEIGV